MDIRSFHRLTFLAVASAAVGMASWAAGATAATPSGETLQTVVSYVDLNLERPEGISKLYQRVSDAAERVCAPLKSRELDLDSAWRKCVDGAVSRALVDINAPALTAVADARRGDSPKPMLVAGVK